MKKNSLSKQKQNIEELSKDDLEKLIRENPEVAGMVLREEQISMHSGPIPSPEVLKGYGDIDSSFPHRIVTMAEAQSKHRMSMEESVLKSSIVNERVGMVLGAVIASISIVGGLYLALNDKNLVGFSAIFVPIGSILSIFYRNKKDEKEEIEKNNKELEEIKE